MSNAASIPDPPSSPANVLNSTTCENEVECSKPALVTCHHCPKRLCLTHVLEHNEVNIVRTYALSDEINCLTHLLSKLDCQQSVEKARKQLDTWKENILADIESTYGHYSTEINDLQNELNHRVDIFKESQRSKMSILQIQLAALQKVGEISQNVKFILDFFLNCYSFVLFSISNYHQLNVILVIFDNVSNQFDVKYVLKQLMSLVMI
jgi:hypothetical protein